MSSAIQSYLITNDASYAPIVEKPSLQGYDPYQTHDLYCDDIVYGSLIVLGTLVSAPASKVFNNFLAVERTSPIGEIECDFESIALAYP